MLKGQNFIFWKIADGLFDELKVQTCKHWFFLMIFLFLLAIYLCKLPKYQNIPRSYLTPGYAEHGTDVQNTLKVTGKATVLHLHKVCTMQAGFQ